MVALALLPSTTLSVLAEDESVKLGVGTTTVREVEAVSVPEVPLTFTVYDPGLAVAPAVKETVLEVVLLVGLKLAVTPVGRPEAVKLTEPVKPFAAATLIAEVAALPPIGADKAVDAGESVKLGGRATVTELVPDAPL